MHAVLDKIQAMGIVPVVVLNDSKDAAPLASALCGGGLPCAEVTFRTDAAEASIRIMKTQFPEMTIGAGTILTTQQVERAMDAGAEFIVSPGFDKEIVDYCIAAGIPVVPGAVTPSEVAQVVKAGLEVVKFFPAEPAGGLTMIKALAAPYSMLKFMPTGGINSENVKDYLKYEKIAACGGSWMVQNSLITEQKFDEIKSLTKEAVEIVKQIRA